MTSTSDEVGHTETPWTITPEKTREIDWLWVMHEQTRICRVVLYHGEKEEQRANAAFILRACNSHDSLVKALEAAQATLRHVHDLLIDRQTFSRTRETINAECRSITAALSQAKGGK